MNIVAWEFPSSFEFLQRMGDDKAGVIGGITDFNMYSYGFVSHRQRNF